MALWLTVVIALTCLGGLASPSPVTPSPTLKELIEELVNITQNQASLCNGSMVWSVNLTAGMYCAALESLINVSDCSAIQSPWQMPVLSALVSHHHADLFVPQQISSERSRDTKIEVIQLVKNLLTYVRGVYRHGNFR
uniref:Interleukin-13 n=1 Tax=Canis lupus familiaris TaxID=9615 RepID=A0A8C0QE97_CANLF